MEWGFSDALLILAGTFLALHLLTDARRMLQVLRLQHSRKAHKLGVTFSCTRCEGLGTGVKEAWWEVLTLVALVGHIIMDYVG